MPPKIDRVEFLYYCLMHNNGTVDAAAVAREFNDELSASAVKQRLGRIIAAFREKKIENDSGGKDSQVRTSKSNGLMDMKCKTMTGKKRKADEALADEEPEDASCKRVKEEVA